MAHAPVSDSPGRSLEKTLRECDGDPCDCLADKIKELASGRAVPSKSGIRYDPKGIKQRIRQQTKNELGSKYKQGKIYDMEYLEGWRHHDKEIDNLQKSLKRHLKEFNRRKCKNDIDIDDKEQAYADRPKMPEDLQEIERRISGRVESVHLEDLIPIPAIRAFSVARAVANYGVRSIAKKLPAYVIP